MVTNDELSTRDLVLRHLGYGPLYEGTLGLLIDRPDLHSALNNLKVRGKIERTPGEPLTWRLTERAA